jgi:LysM repeat protein
MRRAYVVFVIIAGLCLLPLAAFAQNNPATTPDPSAGLAADAAASAPQQAAAAAEITHVVAPGENLYRIAVRYKVTIAAIVARNNIANPNLVYVGQRLIIPGGSGPAPTAVPGTNPTPPPGQVTTYRVVRGDTLARIAQRFGTTVQALAALNGITNPNRIFAGQVLKISGGTGPAPQPTPVGTPPVSVSGGFELGGHVFGFQYAAQMRGAGMTWAKTQIVWDGSAPASSVAGAINAAKSNGFKVLLGIKGNPAQIAANPSQYYQNFANFLGGVAALNPAPDAIEVWNEQNIDREWPVGQINGASYTQMLSAAYQAVKKANGNVLVISGAPAPTGFFAGKCANNGCDDDIYLRQMSQAGAAQFMDCVGIHYNEGILAPSRSSGDPRGNSGHYTRYYPTMVNLYAGVFPNKPLCFTELGYLSGEGYGPLPPAFSWAANTTAQNQAIWLAEAAKLARDSRRVRLMIVWNVDATVYGADPQAGYAVIRPNNTCNACVTLGAVMSAK